MLSRAHNIISGITLAVSFASGCGPVTEYDSDPSVTISSPYGEGGVIIDDLLAVDVVADCRAERLAVLRLLS